MAERRREEKGKDNRRFLRLDLATDVKYRLIKSEKKLQTILKHRVSNLRNISEGGLCLAINEHVQHDDVMKLMFALPDGHPPVVAFADVAWIKKKEDENIVGVRFMAIKENDVKRINSFISLIKKG